MKKLEFSGAPLRTDLGDFAKPKNGVPFIYILTEIDSKAPFYIGEYGKAQTYNVISRIKRHFGRSGTLARVALNMPKFGHNLPSRFNAYVKELPNDFKDISKRISLEAWVIYKACHVEKMQDNKFCVTKYAAPTHDYSELASKILAEFKECS